MVVIDKNKKLVLGIKKIHKTTFGGQDKFACIGKMIGWHGSGYRQMAAFVMVFVFVVRGLRRVCVWEFLVEVFSWIFFGQFLEKSRNGIMKWDHSMKLTKIGS